MIESPAVSVAITQQETQPYPNDASELVDDDLTTYTFEELTALKRDVDAELESRKAKVMEAIRAKVAVEAQALGVSVAELFGLPSQPEAKRAYNRGQPYSQRKKPLACIGPNGERWGGHGPKPAWLKTLLEQGRELAEFQVRDQQ